MGNSVPLISRVLHVFSGKNGRRGNPLGTDGKKPCQGYPNRAGGGGNEGKEENFTPFSH